MAGSASPIQELRTSLEKSRWQLHDSLLRLEDSLWQDVHGAPAFTREPVDTPQAPVSVPIRHLPPGKAARMMSVALMAGLAAGLSWSRRKR